MLKAGIIGGAGYDIDKKLPYIIENIKAKNIILAQGVNSSLVELPYMQISPIFGLRVDVKTSTKIPFNIHKSISVSTNKENGTVFIGATQQRHDLENMKCETTFDKCEFYINTDEAKINTLLSQADELIKLEDVEVVKTYKGARASIKSYFPVVGKAIDYKSSLDKYPNLNLRTIVTQGGVSGTAARNASKISLDKFKRHSVPSTCVQLQSP